MMARLPRRRASSATGKTPFTGRTAPLSASSPTKLKLSNGLPFLFYIGWREIDRGPPARPKIAAIADRGRDPVAALLYRRIRQTNDHNVRIAIGGINLDLDFVSVDAEDGGGVDPGEHDARLAEDSAEVQARV